MKRGGGTNVRVEDLVVIGCVECTVCVYRCDAPILGGAGVVG